MSPSTPQIEIILQIFEGLNFHLLDHDSSLIITGNLDRLTLSSGPIPVSSISGLRLEIGEEMIWQVSQRNFKRIRTTKALKLECLNVTKSGSTVNLGYIIMNLKDVTTSSKNTLGWRRLLGNKMSYHNCPQLQLSLHMKYEGSDIQHTLSPQSEIEGLSNGEPQLVVKNGLTFIGPERFCTKRFQLTCVLNKASNLDMLNSNNTQNKKYHLELFVLGQLLTSSFVDQLSSDIEFGQTFVFDVMSSGETFAQYLRGSVSVELRLLSEENSLGSCKQYIDSLEVGKKVQVICIMNGSKTVSKRKVASYPSVEILLSLHALDKCGNYIEVPVKSKNRITEAKAQETETHVMSSDVPEPENSNNLKNFELIDLTSEDDQNEGDGIEHTNLHSQADIDAHVHPESREAESHLNEQDIEITTEVKSLNITEDIEHNLPKNKNAITSQKAIEEAGPVHTGQNSARSVASKESVLKLNLADLKFPENNVACGCSERLSNSELLAKVVDELEEWKYREKILFAEDLKQQKERMIARWEEEQKTRAEEHEKTRKEVLKHTKFLASQLEQELKTLHHKAEELASEEEKFKNLSKTLQEKYSRKVKAHEAQYQEAKSKMEAMSQHNRHLQQQVGILQHENKRLTSKAQGSESSQLAKLKEQVRSLEKQVLQTQQEKASLVKKWIIGQQDASQGSATNNQGDTQLRTQKHRLQATLEEERKQLLSERARLEQLRLELDNVGLLCSPDTEEVDVTVKPRSARSQQGETSSVNADSADAQLQRMQYDREELLKSGLYPPESDLIQALDKAIQLAMQN